jgi:hypothetical protein
MFRKTEEEQMSMFDRYNTAGKQAQVAVNGSRAKLIGDVIYPRIDEEKFSCLFSDVASRPNISIRRYVSASILKRSYDISETIMLELLRCGALNFQYALHTTNEDEQPLSESSLRRFRRAVEAYNKEHKCDLIKDEFVRISRLMAIDMGLLGKDVDTESGEAGGFIARMDSMEIEAHAKKMTRVEIVYTTIAIVLRYLCKKGFESIIPESFGHYFDDGDKNRLVYHRGRKDKAEGRKDTRLEECIKEMLLLKGVLEENFSSDILKTIPEYDVFQRVLDDQTKTDQDGNIVPKSNGEISAKSVQNPFDTTATYRHKKHAYRGYALNVVEAIDGKGNGIIIDADLEPNVTSDAAMAEAYLERQPDNGPRQVISADGAYDSTRLDELAEQKNIEIQTTALTGAEPWDIDADFTLNDEGTAVLSCPCGHVPVHNKYNPKTGMIIAHMPNNCCANCPHANECDTYLNEKKGTSKVHISKKMVTRARKARRFGTEEGKANGRQRNGVEGIMSVMRRKYNIDHLPVFGIERYRLWTWTTLLAYNIAKYQKWLLSQKIDVAA